ncbi:MAG: alpha/beta fold hydrolase [Desulfosudaceae bacterium]
MTSDKPVQLSVDIGDTEIEYLLYESSGPTIVFLHATGFMPWIWHPIAREFAGQARVVIPYFCDHRVFDPARGGLSWYQLGQDLARFCETLDINAPLMVGHSMGGAVITLAVGEFGVAAEKMILFEPIFLPSQLYHLDMRVEDHPLAGKSIKRRNTWEDRQEARDYLRSKPLFARWDEEMLDMYLHYGFLNTEAGGLTLACHPEREASLFMGSMAYDPWPVMPRVTCPVLILEGENSENRSFINLPVAAETFPQGAHELVPDSGHLIPMEKPAESIARIKTFFNF